MNPFKWFDQNRFLEKSKIDLQKWPSPLRKKDQAS